jgi:hypothetical protein
MATYARRLVANLGAAASGLTGTLAYTVLDAAGVPLVARTTAGVAERGATGIYVATVAAWDAAWAGTIEWDAGAGVLAVEDFGPTVQAGDLAGLSRFDPAADPVTLGAAGLDAVAVEPGLNARQLLALIGAMQCGRAAGVPSGTVLFHAAGAPETERVVSILYAV